MDELEEAQWEAKVWKHRAVTVRMMYQGCKYAQTGDDTVIPWAEIDKYPSIPGTEGDKWPTPPAVAQD